MPAIRPYTPPQRARSVAELRAAARAGNFEGRHIEKEMAVGGVLMASTEARRIDTVGRFTGDGSADQLATIASPEYRVAFYAVLRGNAGPRERGLVTEANAELRDLGVAVGTAGGTMVPLSFLQHLTIRTQEASAMRRLANEVPTQSGSDAPWPANDDVAAMATIQGENTVVTALDVAFTTQTIKTYVYASGLVKASQQLIQDGAFDLEAFLALVLGARYARRQNLDLTVGDGAGKPVGLIPTARVGVTGATGSSTTVTYGSLVDLVTSVDESYRSNAVWMMGDAAFGMILKLADTTTRPLFAPSTIAGVPHTLLGFPLHINNSMPAPGANNRSILFGNVRRAYVCRPVVGQTSVMRLTQRYADQLQVGFLSWSRVGGMPDDPAAVAVYVHSAT